MSQVATPRWGAQFNTLAAGLADWHSNHIGAAMGRNVEAHVLSWCDCINGHVCILLSGIVLGLSPPYSRLL